MADYSIPLSVQEVQNLIVFLERVVCHEGDKAYPPRFTADYIRAEAQKLLDKVVGITGAKLDAHFSTPTVPAEPSTCSHVWSSRGVCQLCPAVKTP